MTRRGLVEYLTYIPPPIQSGDLKSIAASGSSSNHSLEVIPVVKQVHVDAQLTRSYYSSSQPTPSPSYISGDYNVYSFKFVARIIFSFQHQATWTTGDGFTVEDKSIFESVTSLLSEAKNVSVVGYKLEQNTNNASLINVHPLSLELSITTNSFCSFDGDNGAYKHFQLLLDEVINDGSWMAKINFQGLYKKQIVAITKKPQFPQNPPEYKELRTSASKCSFGLKTGLDTPGGTSSVNDFKSSSLNTSSDGAKQSFYLAFSLIVVFIVIASVLYMYCSNHYMAKAKKQVKVSLDSVPSATAETLYREPSDTLEPVMYVEETTELDDGSPEAVNNLATASNWNISDRTIGENHLDTSIDYPDSHFDYDQDDDDDDDDGSLAEGDDSLN